MKQVFPEEFESFEEYFNSFDKVHYEFEMIPDKLHPNNKICAFMKVYELVEDKTRFSIYAEQDTIALNNENDMRQLTEEDIIYLQKCGICYVDFGFLIWT